MRDVSPQCYELINKDKRLTRRGSRESGGEGGGEGTAELL